MNQKELIMRQLLSVIVNSKTLWYNLYANRNFERRIIMLKFICYPKCTTCKKAQSFLEENKVEYIFRDIKEDNPTYEEIKRWHEMSGLPLRKFFNTSGLLYKSMGLKDKLSSMTEEEQYKLLSTDGMLVKRPILVGENFVLTGFRAEQWAEKLLCKSK